MDTARQRLEAHRRLTLPQRLLRTTGLKLLTSRHGRRLAAAGLRMAHLLRLARLDSLPVRLKRLLQLLPESRTVKTIAPIRAAPAARGRVNLFVGCTGELFDLSTLQASRLLLERLGYTVDSPARQTCCGALHQHTGLAQQARELADLNREAFADNGDPVLAFASGCCAQLQSYTDLYPETADFGRRVTDIVAFLAGCDAGELIFRSLPEQVAVYLPCTQRNRLGASAIGEILAWIPQLQTHLVNPDGGCCGAAGSYMLTQPDMSDQLRDAIVERVIDSGSRILVTTNIGCSLQLGAGLRQRGASVRVMHPLALLAAQLE
jgi:glycolate oxidase iron-sulfur subunit